jgi:hypothetical protein
MNAQELTALLERIRREPHETEWLEFKENYYEPQVLGEYLSALANAACLAGKPMAELTRKGRIENRGSRGYPAWYTVDKPDV